MSTRGAYGFIKNKEMKVSYNHYDSYPEGLGEDVVSFIKTTSKESLNEIFNNIELVNQNDVPNEEQMRNIKQFLKDEELDNRYDPVHFGNGKIDWYYLLNPCQGNMELFKSGLKYMTDDKDFLEDNLFCEYAYLIDLDNNSLIIRSNEKEVIYDLDNIPDNWVSQIYPELENSCKDKYMNLMFQKSPDEQKNIIEELGFTDYVKSKIESYNYYTAENNYKDILENVDEKTLESVLDNYINKDLEIES